MLIWRNLTLLLAGCVAAAGPVLPQSLPDGVRQAPFDFADRQIGVDVLIEGQGPFRMHIDTGVYPSAVDEMVAERLQLETSEPVGFIAGFGTRQIEYRNTTLGSVALGGAALRAVPAVVTETRHLVVDGEPSMGILGESFFRRSWVQVDYPARIVRLLPFASREPRPKAPGVPLSIDVKGRTPRLLGVRINDQPVEAWLDTGASAGLILPRSQAEELGLDDAWDLGEPVQGRGARGKTWGRKTIVAWMSIDGVTIPDVVTVIVPGDGGILIGNGALQSFVLTLDYAAGEVWLAGSSDSSSNRQLHHLSD